MSPAWLTELRTKTRVPAIGAITIEGGLIRPAEVEGNTRLGFNDPVTADMPWHLGSNSKAFTAALFATFVREGKATYESKIVKLLEIDPSTIGKGWENLSVRDLLEQTGGVPTASYPGGFGWYYDTRPLRTQRLEYVKASLKNEPVDAGKFVYANANYVILGAVCEKLGNRDWETLIESRLFKPLGIEKAGFGPCPKQAPQPHKSVEGAFALLDVDDVTDNAPVLYPAGGIHMSLRDYAKWLQAVMDENGPLTKPTWRLLVTPTSISARYASGWLLVREHGRARFMTHMGSNTMNIAGTWIDFERKRAIAVMANAMNDAAMLEINRVLRDWVSKTP